MTIVIRLPYRVPLKTIALPDEMNYGQIWLAKDAGCLWAAKVFASRRWLKFSRLAAMSVFRGALERAKAGPNDPARVTLARNTINSVGGKTHMKKTFLLILCAVLLFSTALAETATVTVNGVGEHVTVTLTMDG